MEIQHYVMCIDLGYVLHPGESAPFPQSVVSNLASQLYLQKAIPLLYQADNFWVMRYEVELVGLMTMYLLCFLCKVGSLIPSDICGIWVSKSNILP